MFVLCYNHEYGTDVGLYPTLELAEQAACVYIVNWFQDIAGLDGNEEVAKYINAGQYSQARMRWSEMDHMETMSISRVVPVRVAFRSPATRFEKKRL
jgi:hypothetical protein